MEISYNKYNNIIFANQVVSNYMVSNQLVSKLNFDCFLKLLLFYFSKMFEFKLMNSFYYTKKLKRFLVVVELDGKQEVVTLNVLFSFN
jgi:hypothetical protein